MSSKSLEIRPISLNTWDILLCIMENNTNIVRKNPSKAWYLLPIFFGLLGGLIMFFVLKDENRQMAKNGVILGVVLTVVGIMLVVVTQLAFISTMPSVWICLIDWKI